MSRLFLLFAMMSAFFICGEYSMIRPASSAIFLSFFSAKTYPWVWCAIVPLNFLSIYVYNRFLPKLGPFKMVTTTACIVVFVNVGTALLSHKFSFLIFLQYMWKDIYVLLMLKQLWSMIHSTVPIERSKYLYGKIYGMGTLGAILGSLLPTFFAVHIGAENILLFSLPAYAIVLFCYFQAFKRSPIRSEFVETLTTNPKPSEALTLIKNSVTLKTALALVVFMQFSAGLMEYQFNANLELNILEKNLRAAYCGKLGGIINSCSLILQLFGAGLLLRNLGLQKSQMLMPILLGSFALLSLISPTFGMISFSYVALKTVDFSLVNVLREMLYAPLSPDEKFRAKAIIDVFAYRSSKALVSVVILSLQAVAGIYLLGVSRILSVAIFLGWLLYLYSKKSQEILPESV